MRKYLVQSYDKLKHKYVDGRGCDTLEEVSEKVDELVEADRYYICKENDGYYVNIFSCKSKRSIKEYCKKVD